MYQPLQNIELFIFQHKASLLLKAGKREHAARSLPNDAFHNFTFPTIDRIRPYTQTKLVFILLRQYFICDPG